jgi:hypothetical protein
MVQLVRHFLNHAGGSLNPVSDAFLRKPIFVITAFVGSVNIEVTIAYKNAGAGIKAYLIPHAANSESLSGMGVNQKASQYREMPISTKETANIRKRIQNINLISV